MKNAAIFLSCALAASAASAQSKPPLEAGAALDGADALSGNVGTLGFHQGLGLAYRHFGPPKSGDSDVFLGAWSPLPLLTIGAGIEYARPVPDQRFVLGAFGLALRPARWVSLAFAYHPFKGLSRFTGAELSTVDVGIGLRPARWVSLALAIENLNAPEWAPFLKPRTYAISAALRPFLSELVTVGADVRLLEGMNWNLWPAPRLTVELRPTDWLGIMASADTRGQYFVGLSLRERHLEAGFGLGLAGAGGLQGSYTYARLSTEARPGFSLTGKATAQVELAGDLRPSDPLTALFTLSRPGFGEIPLTLRALAERDDIAAVRVVMQSPRVGLATLHDLRDALLDLRRHGKKVIVDLGDAGDKELYLASAADTIIAEPQATIAFNGVKATLHHFKNALEKIGVRVEAHASGPYKTAPQAFTEGAPSKEALEVQNALLDNFFAAEVNAVAEGRHLAKDKVQALIDRALFSGHLAKEAGLVDTLAAPADPAAPPTRTVFHNLVRAEDTALVSRGWNHPPAIALIAVEGTIMGGESLEDPFGLFAIAGANTVAHAVYDAFTDPEVKAVVLRINSPGGDILASDIIWQELRRFKGTKPLVVSMGDVAASGGYYIAAPADVIFAQPETITGSIGVFNMKIDLSGLLAKLGITTTTLRRGRHADIFDMERPLDASEKKIFDDYVAGLYHDFVAKVAHGRKLDAAVVDAVARGRVWTGAQARQNHLVDRLGGLLDAIDEAKRLAGYEPRAALGVKPFPQGPSPWRRFAGEFQNTVFQNTLGAAPKTAAELENLVDVFKRVSETFDGRAMYLFPYMVSVD